jgi:hypothetical protein
MNEKELFKQLEVAFGSKKAKKLVKQIREIKAEDPNARYSFYFGEDGTLTTVRKNINDK